MNSPLQMLPVPDRETTTICETYTRQSIAVIHQQKERESLHIEQVLSMTWSPKNRRQSKRGMDYKKSHIATELPLIISIYIDRSEKRMYESCTNQESYPALEKTELNDATSLEQSPRKILFAYDCKSISLYENQERCIHDYAERESKWDISTAMSHESFARGAVSTPERSTAYSDAMLAFHQH